MAGKMPCHCGTGSVFYVKDMTFENVNDSIVAFLVLLMVSVHVLPLHFIDCLYTVSLHATGVGLNSKQRQRKDTD